MNFTGLFIRRPVMTTLVMAGILIFGIVAYRLLPVSDLPAVDYPTISVSASLPGASPETMASSVATPLEKQFSTIRRPRCDDLDEQPGRHLDHPAVRPEPRHRCRGAGRPVGHLEDAAHAAPGHAPAELPEGGPVGQPDPLLRPPHAHALALEARRVRGEHAGTAPLHRSTAWPRCRCTARRSTRCASSSTRRRSRRAGSASTRSSTAVDNGNVNLPTGILWGTDKAYSVESNGQLNNAAEFGALIVAYRDGAPVRLARSRPRRRQCAGHQDGELVQRRAGHRAGHPAAARHQYRRRGAPGQGRNRAACGRASPRRSSWRRSTIARSRSRRR